VKPEGSSKSKHGYVPAGPSKFSEEVRKGMREKAEQGHWPTVAHVGYLNNSETHRIETDPVRGPMVAQMFEWYARGDVSLKEVARLAGELGLTHPRAHRRLVKSEVHRILRNPIYAGEFIWKGRRYEGHHQPLISRSLRKLSMTLRHQGRSN